VSPDGPQGERRVGRTRAPSGRARRPDRSRERGDPGGSGAAGGAGEENGTDQGPIGREPGTRERADPADPVPADAVPDEPAHDPAGLALARSIARTTGRSRRRRRTSDNRPSEPQASGAHPDDRDPKPLGAALDRLVESKGWSTEIDVHTLLGRWPALVGPELATHSRPESYGDAVLTVRTDSTAWASQLRLLAPSLVAALNHRLGDGTVARVKVLGPDAPSWKKGRLAVRDGRGPRDTYG
jgi:predicted nucleic acid-binding Zn ribbon protein